MSSNPQLEDLPPENRPFVDYEELRSLAPKGSKKMQQKNIEHGSIGMGTLVDSAATAETNKRSGLGLPVPADASRRMVKSNTNISLGSVQPAQTVRWPWEESQFELPTETAKREDGGFIPVAKTNARNITTPHRRFFRPITSRLSKSQTLSSLIPSRQAQGPPEQRPTKTLTANQWPGEHQKDGYAEKTPKEKNKKAQDDIPKESASGREQKGVPIPDWLQIQASLKGTNYSDSSGGNVSSVTTSQPPEYWLGRLTTLVNAFHHEEAFNKPDPAINNLSGSGRQAARLLLIRNPEEYRAKRAFITLRKICETPEARDSLETFRELYFKHFGHQWSPWSTKDLEVDDLVRDNSDQATNADRKREDVDDKVNNNANTTGHLGSNEYKVMSLLRSVRRSLG